MLLLMIFLLLPHAALQQQRACLLSQQLQKIVKEEHNNLRQAVAEAQLDKATYGDLLGTDSMFAMKYDCTNDALANALILSDSCKKSELDISLLGKSMNFVAQRALTDPTANMEDYFKFAVEDWSQSVSKPLSKDAVYNDVSMEPFANMIFYKSVTVGCAYAYCQNPKRLAIACVYGDVPKLGQPLYLPEANAKGCTDTASCEKVIAGATCATAPADENKLCTTSALRIDSSTTTAPPTTQSTAESTSPTVQSSASPTAPTTASPTVETSTSPTVPTTASPTVETSSPTLTTAGPTLEVMTQEVRDKIVTMHNYRRSILAQGTVRNGKPGNANCPTATNMYRMRYDTYLETEAQQYAIQCTGSGSPVSQRQTGENSYIFENNNSITALEAVTGAIKAWFSQIFKNGVNMKMKYNEFLETKDNAPTAFTQMAWAASYKIGCGVSRCNYGTMVVCRYSPRGNIYTQYIYNVGPICASCSGSCQDALCPAPPN